MVRPLLSCALLLCWSFALCSAQSNSDQQQPAAPAAMPGDNAATSPPTPPDDRQDFAQNVKDVYFDFDRYNLRGRSRHGVGETLSGV
jgi:outer membrane protein OmpA-like peptidoglycan-associated protein